MKQRVQGMLLRDCAACPSVKTAEASILLFQYAILFTVSVILFERRTGACFVYLFIMWKSHEARTKLNLESMSLLSASLVVKCHLYQKGKKKESKLLHSLSSNTDITLSMPYKECVLNNIFFLNLELIQFPCVIEGISDTLRVVSCICYHTSVMFQLLLTSVCLFFPSLLLFPSKGINSSLSVSRPSSLLGLLPFKKCNAR